MFNSFLESPQLFDLLLSAVGFAMIFVFRSVSARYLTLQESDSNAVKTRKTLIEGIMGGVDKVYAEFVKHCKDRNADGKLSSVEKKYALEQAKLYAIEYAKEKGVDAAKEYGVAYIAAEIEDYITKRKAVAAQSKPIIEEDVQTDPFTAASEKKNS